MLPAHQRSLFASSPLCWRPIKSPRGSADVYRITYDDGHGMHTSPRDQKEIGGSFAYNFTGLMSVRLLAVIDVPRCSTHGRLNWIIGRGDPPLRLSQRTARARLGWRLGCERRHRPNPSKSHQQPRGGAVVTRRAIALVFSTHILRVAEPKAGRQVLADGVSDMPCREHCLVWTSVVYLLLWREQGKE